MLFSLADSWLSVNQHSHELACADGWSVPGNECSALPSLSPVSTFHIQCYTNAEPSPFPPHFPPAVSCNYPLTAFFFFPTAQNVARSTSQQDRKSLSLLVASAFLAPWCTVNAGNSDSKREGRKDRQVVGAEGLHKHDEYKGSKHKPGCHNTLSV